MNKSRILVVDDDPKISALLRIILERIGGYHVREENRSFAALKTAQEFRPHFVILDVHMPGKDGGDVAAELRADPRFAATPIVFLTSLVSKDETGQHGNMPFLAKPVDPQALLSTIRRMLTPVVAA